MTARTGDPDGGEAPVLRVVRGDATPEELAALVAVLGALGGRPVSPRGEATVSAWTDRRATVRSTDLHHGPGAWRSSFWPR